MPPLRGVRVCRAMHLLLEGPWKGLLCHAISDRLALGQRRATRRMLPRLSAALPRNAPHNAPHFAPPPPPRPSRQAAVEKRKAEMEKRDAERELAKQQLAEERAAANAEIQRQAAARVAAAQEANAAILQVCRGWCWAAPLTRSRWLQRTGPLEEISFCCMCVL